MTSPNLDSIKKAIFAKKDKLDRFQPIDPNITKNMGDWLRNELTYTSNALEGNTLTRQETQLIVDEGISIGGKKLNEILEAKNHNTALTRTQNINKNKRLNKLCEQDLLELHSCILQGIDDHNGGKYRSVPVRITGSMMIPPNHLKVSELMGNLLTYIRSHNPAAELSCVDIAIEAHYQLVSIHPFIDGNGRTARLLFNLILLEENYPLVFIAKEDRSKYLSALEKAQTGGSKEDYQQLMLEAIERSLDLYLAQVNNWTPNEKNPKPEMLKIGELAKATGQDVATIRYWTTLGLLEIFGTTKSNYALYNQDQIDKVKQIRFLQRQKRLSLAEIKGLI